MIGYFGLNKQDGITWDFLVLLERVILIFTSDQGKIISKILLIEDNPQNALLVKRLLEARDHQIIHAIDGESGLTKAIEEIPELVLVDLGLPDIDGQTLVTLIKRTPELKHIPIVAVTAWPEETAKEMALAYGCDGFISKPISTRTFPDQIAGFLVKK